MTITIPSRKDRLGVCLAVLLLGGPGVCHAQSALPFRPGETVHYSIKKLGVKAGNATLVFNGAQKLAGRDVILITFTATAFNFYDEEKIYVDPQTFYPLRVERDLNIFGKKEKIWEIYDHAKGEINIIKFVKNREVRETLQKDGKVDNIYCFLYRFRTLAPAMPGDTFQMNLPTRDVTIEYVERGKMKLGGTLYQTMYLRSDPREYKIWFDQSPQKIPLRIDGAMGIASMSLIMTDYQAP